MNTTKMKVIVVDDHEILRKGITDLIRRKPDIEVVGEAENGEKAVQMAQKLKPNVVLMDFNMPGINGIESSEQIMHENPGIKIILMSAALTIHIIERAIEAGILGIMSKESVVDEFENAICSLRKGHIFCCSEVMQTQLENAVLV